MRYCLDRQDLQDLGRGKWKVHVSPAWPYRRDLGLQFQRNRHQSGHCQCRYDHACLQCIQLLVHGRAVRPLRLSLKGGLQPAGHQDPLCKFRPHSEAMVGGIRQIASDLIGSRGLNLLVPVQLRGRHHHHGFQGQHLQDLEGCGVFQEGKGQEMMIIIAHS